MCIRLCILLLLTFLVSTVLAQNKYENIISAGNYSVRMTIRGFEVFYKGEQISIGSHLSVFNPGYKGYLVSLRKAWEGGHVSVSDDKHTLVLEAKLPEGSIKHSATVSPEGVRITSQVKIIKDTEVGPVEHAAFQIPTKLMKDGRTIEVFNLAGVMKERVFIPSVPKRGRMARCGAKFVIKTPARNIVISSAQLPIYPFDARVRRYEDQPEGVWAFTFLPTIEAGQKTIFATDIRVASPDPVPIAGTITLDGFLATAVATVPSPTDQEKFAADELVTYLAKISGKTLDRIEIAEAKIPPGVIAIGRLAQKTGLISPGELDAVQRDGYIIKVKDSRAAISGWRDLGTIYGVYGLLRHIGWRFYALGVETIPEIKDLNIPELKISAKPSFELRYFWMGPPSGCLKLGNTPFDEIGCPSVIGGPGNVVHSAAFLVPFDKFHKDHPEFFALQADGKRLRRDLHTRWGQFWIHLCLSNPEVKRIATERLLKLMDKLPDRTWFGVSQGDGFAKWWCHCENCQALDAIPGVHMADRLLTFVNYLAREVAKKHPEKKILTLAYTSATSPPPTRVMPEPNVMIMFCPYPPEAGCQSHGLTCPKNKVALADLKGWLEFAPNNMFIFDYPRGYYVGFEPFGAFYAMVEKLDFYQASGIRGIVYCGVPENFMNLFIFVQSKLHWDPEADVEALIDDFMTVYYGKAAPYIREYFDFKHRQIVERWICQMCEGENPGLVTPQFSEKALGLFRRAEEAVKYHLVVLHRVRVEKFNVLFADINERNLVNNKIADSKADFSRRLAEFIQIARTRKITHLGRGYRWHFEPWFERATGIRLRATPWFTDPLVDKIITNPLKTLIEEKEKRLALRKIPSGWLLPLDGFEGNMGPTVYSYRCPPRRAVWIYGTNTGNPEMWVSFYLDKLPSSQAYLVLLAQDDDKPGTVEINIFVNNQEIFRGPNTFVEFGWSTTEFPIPAGVLKQGENEILFKTLKPSLVPARDVWARDDWDQGWFMIAECKVLFR